MAYTRVLDFKEKTVKLRAAAGVLQDMIAKTRATESYRDKIIDEWIEEGYANISTEIQAQLDDLAGMADRVRAILADFDDATTASLIYEEFVRPYTENSAFTSWAIDYDNGSGDTKITANGGAPFTNYGVGAGGVQDKIKISSCSESTYDGEYTIKSKASNVEIVIDGPIGDGSVTDDIAADTTMTIKLMYQKTS